MFLWHKIVMVPSIVSIPKDKGFTSKYIISRSSSLRLNPRISPYIAAPYTTASSGLIDILRVFPFKKSEIIYWTLGILLEPPTSTISWIWFFLRPESFSTFSTGDKHFLKRSSQSSSNLALVIYMLKSSSPERNSHSIGALSADERILLAFSH